MADLSGRNRSASSCDTGLPQHDNKRLRLSDASHLASPASAGAPETSPSTEVVPSPVAESDSNAQHLSPSASSDHAQQHATSPTSKMTINTRPWSAQAAALNVSNSLCNGESRNPTTSGPASSSVESIQFPTSGSDRGPETISISSSDGESPPFIDIVALEDDNKSPSQAPWEASPKSTEQSSTSIPFNHVSETFPFINDYQLRSHECVAQICKAVQAGLPEAVRIFRAVKRWLSDFVGLKPHVDHGFLDEESQFWNLLPQIGIALLQSNSLNHDDLAVQEVTEFFADMLRLLDLIVKLDTRRFQSYSERIDFQAIRLPHSASYFVLFYQLWQPTPLPLLKALSDVHNVKPDQVLNHICANISKTEASSMIVACGAYFKTLTAFLPQKPAMISQIFSAPVHSMYLFRYWARDIMDKNQSSSSFGEEDRSLLTASLRYLEEINSALDRAVVKQHSWLTLENCQICLNHFVPFVTDLARSSAAAARTIVASAGVDPDFLADEDLADLSASAWKFMTLFKLLKNGRMELRVFAIESMNLDLISIFKTYIGTPGNGLDHPVVRFTGHFIRDNGLVKYVIGIDSHPQIISRSSSIIGFLVVSGDYENSDTDVIWQAALDTSDPRAGVAVWKTLDSVSENFSDDAVCHLFSKLLCLAIERYTQPILDFTLSTFSKVIRRFDTQVYTTESWQKLSVYMTKICVKLLREANTSGSSSSEVACHIRQQIPIHLKSRIEDRRGQATALPLEESKEIIRQLSADIQNASQYICGSSLVICQFLRTLPKPDFEEIVHEDQIMSLTMDHLLSSVPPTPLEASTRLLYETALSNVQPLLVRSSTRLPDHLLNPLWDKLLSSTAVPDMCRLEAWQSLAECFDYCESRNPTLDHIVNVYFESLPPRLFNEEVLHFIQKSFDYEIKIQQSYGAHEKWKNFSVLNIKSLEHLWRIVLDSPQNTVEIMASDFIISRCVDGPAVASLELNTIQAMHMSIADRCITQVIDEASHIKGHTSSELNQLHLHRSLMFLQRFLNTLQDNPSHAQYVRGNLTRVLRDFVPRGQSFTVKVSVHNHPSVDSTFRDWTLGTANTGREIWEFISDMTNWSKFNVLAAGQRKDLQNSSLSLQALNLTNGPIIIAKVQESVQSASVAVNRASSPLRQRIMEHFDALYDLLNLEDDLAQSGYRFLMLFPCSESILGAVRSIHLQNDILLQVERPYKLMYIARALRVCIEEESFKVEPDQKFIANVCRALVKALEQLPTIHKTTQVVFSVSFDLMNVLLRVLRIKTPESTSLSYLEDHKKFGDCLLFLWRQGIESGEFPAGQVEPQVIVRTTFETMIEATFHDVRLWSVLDQEQVAQMFEQSLLSNTDSQMRLNLFEAIGAITNCETQRQTSQTEIAVMPQTRHALSKIDLSLGNLWECLLTILPRACKQTTFCLEYFNSLTSLLRVCGAKLDIKELKSLIEQWLSILLRHEHVQEIGHPSLDFVTVSLASLILEALNTYDGIVVEIERRDDFSRQIFETFLFPPLATKLDGGTSTSVPVLDISTRKALYSLTLSLSKTPADLEKLIHNLGNDLLPENVYFPPGISSERQILRSPSGYAGLRNLSNTCYLNSLLVQLFMNVQFRTFLQRINVVDPEKQKLIAELRKVFGYMQNSYEDAVSPEAAVESITTWDGERIDVTVQMDVDEFFNLLFDRIESQVIDPDKRTEFKSLYGGQLVQQIKSRECDHVSERLEPFSNVQIEIRGKSGLQDSLEAYVEGEVLQGENKYSCTSCGRHVDAVKRACLKDVPNNLIFSLKRFDFDILNGTRCKINDEFQFPELIDMAPYTLEALSSSNKVVQSDLFELVGIIVHSGTAETGHYYSYVRQRPSPKAKQYSWIQFNDSEVSQFDPGNIRDCTFGGVDVGEVQIPKFYNGYMLFYQRSSSIRDLEESCSSTDSGRVELPPELDRCISEQNELYLRSFVGQDPAHALFIKKVLEALPGHNPPGKCTEDHDLEKEAYEMALGYVGHFSSRWKELPEVDSTLKLIELSVSRCGTCASQIINWVGTADNFAANIIRSFSPTARKAYQQLILCAVELLSERNSARAPYEPSSAYQQLLEHLLTAMSCGWDYLQRHGRAWEQYFGILCFLLKLGEVEAQCVVHAGFLEKALELVHLPNTALKRLRVKYQAYLNCRERGRPFSHGSLVAFIADILPHVDLLDFPHKSHQLERQHDGEKPGLNYTEADLLGFTSQPPMLHWLTKIILAHTNVAATDEIIILLAHDKSLNSAVGRCLRDGLENRSVPQAALFLKPVITFMKHAVSDGAILNLLRHALESIETIDGTCGDEYLAFVQELDGMENNVLPFEKGVLKRHVMNLVHFWAPVLLMYPDDIHTDVRGDTFNYLTGSLFDSAREAEQSAPQAYRTHIRTMKRLAEGCESHVRKLYFEPPPRDRMVLQAGQATQILATMELVVPVYDRITAQEDEAVSNILQTAADLKQLADSVLDAASEWKDAESDMEALSEIEYSEMSP